MTKLFKEYEKKYKPKPTTGEELVRSLGINSWRYKLLHYNHDEVAQAVYYSPQSERWQEFRCGLKGCPTQVKLLRLQQLVWEYNQKEGEHTIWICINNYIGALVRGGQLDSNLNVQR